MTSLPKTSSTLLNGESTPEGKTLEISTSKEEIGAFLGLPEVAEKKYLVDHSKPLPTSLQNDFIPEEFLLSLTSAANAGACPENLLPPKKSKTPKGGLMRKADHVWHHPVRRNKLKHLLDHPVSLTRAGRDISFLYDVRYVKGEVRENVVCPPHTEHSLQSQDGVIVPHKPKRLADTLIPEEFHIVSNTGVSGLECYDDTYTTLLTDSENRLLLFPSMKPNKRVEVAQLNDVMDTMLERAGVENEDYKGPTQMHKLLHMLKKEQTIYNTIFHELIRQVSVDCMDRGELLSKIRDRYTQMLDQIARQMIDFYKDLVTQRVMDQRILEELYNFKNVIEELTRELCLVRAHDIKLTQEAEKTHKDLAQALLDAEKNAKIVEDYHDLYTLQRGRMENDIKQLMTERDIWSSATYDLALKVIVKNKVILAKKIYLNEKGWNKYTKHFIILLSTKDTTDLALLQRLTQKWRTLITKFKQELEQTEESTKEKLQIVKNGLMTWQKVVKNNIGKDGLPSIQEDMLNSMNQECKQWIKLLSDEKDKFTGDSLVSRYDSLKIIKHLQEKWKDIGIEIFSRHKNMDGEMPLEQVYMEKIITIIVKLYKEYELRISGDYGISKSLLNIISFLDFWSFKMLNPLVFSEISPEEWEGFHKRVEEIKSHVATLSNTAGIIPEQMEMDTIEILQAQIFDMIQQWILKIGNEIDNGNIALQRHRDDLHISMIQWMVNLLILMVPGCTDQDTLPPAEEKSTETHELGIAKLELDALGLAKRLAQYSSYLTSCCKGMVTAMVLSKTAQLQNYSTKELQELESVKVYVTLNGEKIETVSDFILLGSTVNTLSSSTQEIKRRITLGKVAVKEISQVLKNNDVSLKTKRECYDWISVCGLLLSELKGRKVMLLKPEEIENLFGEEYFVNEFTEHDSEMSFKENEEESEQVKEEEDEVPSTSMGSEPLIRVIGRDKNIHTKPLFERDALSFWREVAEQGTQTQKQKYMEAMTILEHMQEKLLELESRARKAEEKFDEANEKLHFTLLNNKNLRKELEDMSNKTEGESKRIKDKDIKEEDEDDKGDEEKEGQEAKRLTSASKSPKKDVKRKESSINTKSRVRIKSNHKMKPKQHP